MCQINTDPMRSERGYLKVVGMFKSTKFLLDGSVLFVFLSKYIEPFYMS